VIGERAADQRQRGQRQRVAVEHPLHGSEICAEIFAQSWQCDGQRRTVDERHGRREYAGGQHHAPAPWSDLASELTRAWLGGNNAAAAWLGEGQCHAVSMSLPPVPGQSIRPHEPIGALAVCRDAF
jgi:hypothetical protein